MKCNKCNDTGIIKTHNPVKGRRYIERRKRTFLWGWPAYITERFVIEPVIVAVVGVTYCTCKFGKQLKEHNNG